MTIFGRSRRTFVDRRGEPLWSDNGRAYSCVGWTGRESSDDQLHQRLVRRVFVNHGRNKLGVLVYVETAA